jgi:hypothetical protein
MARERIRKMVGRAGQGLKKRSSLAWDGDLQGKLYRFKE